MAEYTPTTETVRERYWLATVNDTDFPGVEGYADERHTEFDRWLAAEKAEAWDEGYKAGCHGRAEDERRFQMRDWWGDPLTTPNPYRKEADRDR